MPESSNPNKKERKRPISSNEEIVIYSFSEQKKPSALQKIMHFFQRENTVAKEIQKPITLPEIRQPLEIDAVNGMVDAASLNDKFTASNPDINQAVKIITHDLPAIRTTLQAVKEARIPNPTNTIINAVQEQFRREGIPDMKIVLQPDGNDLDLKVELEFIESDRMPQKIYIANVE